MINGWTYVISDTATLTAQMGIAIFIASHYGPGCYMLPLVVLIIVTTVILYIYDICIHISNIRTIWTRNEFQKLRIFHTPLGRKLEQLVAIACYCQVHELVTVDAEDLRFLCAKVLQFPSASVCKVTRKQMQTGSRAKNHTIRKKAWPGLAQMRIHSLWFILTCWIVEGLWEECSSLMVNGHQKYQKIHWCFSFQLGFCKCLADLDDISRSLKLSQASRNQSTQFDTRHFSWGCKFSHHQVSPEIFQFILNLPFPQTLKVF